MFNRIFGIIEVLDRIRFQGTDLVTSNTSGINKALRWVKILLKDFGRWAEGTTKTLRTRCSEQAYVLGIPMEYLRKSGVDKEARAREIVQEQGMGQDGSICMFSVMESCVAPEVCGHKQSKKLELQMRQRKCIFIYYYFDHPEVGFGHVRLQTWLPYSVKICLNGRHWLEKQLLANYMRCKPWLNAVSTAFPP
ncbi:MAG TPA: hypothetical protein PLI09_00470 [Candidatus Hydrogenedentes bacterium]|nr:hypothetical protein [Candidatus Hydrogenedentota bacterium]